jgi:type IV pilus biogenesis protein PilP
MRIKSWGAAAIAAAIIAASPAAADSEKPQPTAESAFRREAKALTELRVLKMERDVADERKVLEGNHPTVPTSAPVVMPTAAAPTVEEIGGSNDRLVALLRFPDGHLQTALPGDTVPGFGRIAGVTLEGVRDAHGNVHPLSHQGGN